MSIAYKLTTIAENQQRVFDAGRNSGGGGDSYNEGYEDGYEVGKTDGYTNGFDEGNASGYLSGLEAGTEQGREEGLAEGIEQGKQEEYDRFWNSYLNPSGFSTWAYRFAGYGWDERTFRPPNDIVPTTACSGIFMSCSIKNLKSLCDSLGIKIDFSKATGLSQIFSDSEITTAGEINATSASTINYLLFNATKIVSIDKVVLKSDGSQTANSAFLSASNLENITFEGVIGQSFDFQYSKKLSRTSIESIINALSTTATGKTLTLSLTAVNDAFGGETPEWDELIATRSNWTISLV